MKPDGTRSEPPRRLRRLSDEEIALWLTVAAGVTRSPGSTLPATREPLPVEPAAAPATAPRALAPDGRLKVVKPAAPPLAPLERKLKQKLSRGRMTADAAIDLHGFRQNEAYAALYAFLSRAQHDGARVALVVTGKGGRRADSFDLSAGEVGVLKRAVPLWLALPEFRTMVVGYEEAGRPHGGAGALYVRLRRRDR